MRGGIIFKLWLKGVSAMRNRKLVLAILVLCFCMLTILPSLSKKAEAAYWTGPFWMWTTNTYCFAVCTTSSMVSCSVYDALGLYSRVNPYPSNICQGTINPRANGYGNISSTYPILWWNVWIC